MYSVCLVAHCSVVHETALKTKKKNKMYRARQLCAINDKSYLAKSVIDKTKMAAARITGKNLFAMMK